jgi:hypothetical protein
MTELSSTVQPVFIFTGFHNGVLEKDKPFATQRIGSESGKSLAAATVP